jgi:hypothetical protein
LKECSNDNEKGLKFMADAIDIVKINSHLKSLELDMIITPITNSINQFWLSSANNRCTLKIPVNFIVELQERLELDEWGKYELLRPLFGNDFIKLKIPGFNFYPKSGFIARDFAEFYIRYDAIENGELLVDNPHSAG